MGELQSRQCSSHKTEPTSATEATVGRGTNSSPNSMCRGNTLRGRNRQQRWSSYHRPRPGGDRIAAVCHKPSTLIDRLRINLTMMFTVTIGQKQCGVNANEQRSPAGRISVASANWLKPKFMQRAAKSGGGCQPHPPATHKPTCNRLKTANFFLAQTTNPTHKKITTLQRGHTRFQLFFEIFCTKMPSPGYPPVGAGFSKCVGARQITSLACQYPGGKFKTFQILTKELHQFFFFLCLRRQKASLPAFS